MNVLKKHDRNGWITAVICGRWCCAKVYDIGSTFGINEGRVSKLSISKTDKRDPDSNFFKQMDFNYCRGHDFNNLPDGILDKIVGELENLPKVPQAT